MKKWKLSEANRRTQKNKLEKLLTRPRKFWVNTPIKVKKKKWKRQRKANNEDYNNKKGASIAKDQKFTIQEKKKKKEDY